MLPMKHPETVEELEQAYMHLDKQVRVILELTGASQKGNYWTGWDGTKYLGQEPIQVLKQEVIKGHALLRVRQVIQTSDLNKETRIYLEHLLNLVERFVHILVKTKSADYMVTELLVNLTDTAYQVLEGVPYYEDRNKP